MKKTKVKRKGISLIMLIITIMIMIILSAVIITSITSSNGIIANAKKATFYAEMQELEERKETAKIISFMTDVTEASKSDEAFLSSNMTEEEITNLPNTLKAEIIYTRNEYGGYIAMTTKYVWNKNMFNCKDIYEDNVEVEGLTNDLMYVNGKVSGKEKGYIYDSVTDTIYKVDKTNIGMKTVHSLNYARFIIDGEKVKGRVIEDEAKVAISTDGTKYYEPDLNNFTHKTEIIYYSSNLSKQETMNVEEYIKKGKPKVVTIDGATYTFANYVSSGTRIWANIKTNANGIDAYWVWIPRYAYKLNQDTQKADVIYVDINDNPLDTEKYGNSLPEGYTVHEAFMQGNGLKGIWFSKYQPSSYETIPIDNAEGAKPDLSDFNTSNTKLIYYTANLNKSIEKEYNVNPEREIIEEGTTYYFYNYEKKIWANIKTTANGIDAYWVWIPRFAYKLETGQSKVILIDENDKPLDTEKYGNSLPEGYTVHEAFAQGNGLKGLWFSKYQPSSYETIPIDNAEGAKPDLSDFNTSNTKLIYYTADLKKSLEVDYTANPERVITEGGYTYYFYDYSKKIWPNIKTKANNINAYWVWIPRYAYKLEVGQAKVILIDENNKPLDTTKYGNSLPAGYTVHEAFTQGDGLKGIWFSKYQPSQITVD